MIKIINEDVLSADLSGLPPINLVVTSPPYNVGIEYDKHVDTMTYDEYLIWCEKWLRRMYDVMAEDGRICINIPFSITPEHLNKKKGAEDINYPVAADYTEICQKIGFKYYRTIIWQKMGSNKTCWGSWRSARAPFIIDPNECILVFYKNQWKRKDTGTSTVAGKDFMTYIKNLWTMNPETRSKHPAAFPIELPKRCIQLLSYKEDTIMDCFLGSGTTGEAAVRYGRNFVGVEMSKDYYAMAKERIEAADLQTSLASSIMPNPPIDAKTDVDNVW
jgi:site-specific DNA-methyltransferase (adenine-specific)